MPQTPCTILYQPPEDVRAADNVWMASILNENYPMIPWKSYWLAFCDPSDVFGSITYEERCHNRKASITKGTDELIDLTIDTFYF
jgi:hypothetical protein